MPIENLSWHDSKFTLLYATTDTYSSAAIQTFVNPKYLFANGTARSQSRLKGLTHSSQQRIESRVQLLPLRHSLIAVPGILDAGVMFEYHALEPWDVS